MITGGNWWRANGIFIAILLTKETPATVGVTKPVDLQAAIDRGITVAEVTYSNSISVSEHVVVMILELVRNYIPSYQWVVKGGWHIAEYLTRSYDVEGMHAGTVAAGRVGLAVLRRLKPFDMRPARTSWLDGSRLDFIRIAGLSVLSFKSTSLEPPRGES